MKLLRFGPKGRERPGVLDAAGRIRDLSAVVDDLDPRGVRALEGRELAPESLPLVLGSPRIGACLSAPGKLICLGFNSRSHSKELGGPQLGDGEVVLFLKAASAINGPFDPLVYPAIGRKLDWEGELAVVIGREGRAITVEESDLHILGYTCMNDVTDRYWQFETGDKQYVKAKSMDGFAPLGPWIATREDVPDPSALRLRLRVNGRLRQDFSAGEYILGCREAVSYASRFFTLLPGDVISMGSAPGNAAAWGEDCFLKAGDVMEFEIEGIGRQETLVVSANSA